MSEDKRITKKARKALQEIEKLCNTQFRRVNMASTTTVENLFNFNEQGEITMLGFNFQDLKLNDVQYRQLGEIVRDLPHVEILLVNLPKNTPVPEWLGEMRELRKITFTDSFLAELPGFLAHLPKIDTLRLIGNKIAHLPSWLPSLGSLHIFNLNDRAQTLALTEENMQILKTLQDRGVKISDPTFTLHVVMGVSFEDIGVIKAISWYEDNINRVFAKPMRAIDEPWADPHTFGVCLKVFEGKIIHLSVSNTPLTTLPDNFGDLKDLRVIYLPKNKLVALPESFGELTNLRELNLSSNQLAALPDSCMKLTNLQKLNLSNNLFEEIPTPIWALKEVVELDLSNNRFSPEEVTISQKVPDLIQEYLRKKATIRIFISHAVIDFEPYRIKELVDYLQAQKEISQVYFCETDLAGNIDQWMLDTVQKCQLVLFIATNKSVFNSPDCDNELQLADKFEIPVIPLKGMDLTWPDLAEKNLSRELGLEYDVQDFPGFCETLYTYITNFKREINLMEKEHRKAGIINIFERFRLIMDESIAEIKSELQEMDSRISKLEERLN